jgi:hypothetical protein
MHCLNAEQPIGRDIVSKLVWPGRSKFQPAYLLGPHFVMPDRQSL